MQYIQFQPQIASQVPNAAPGTVNYFVDASDNLILGKDENGAYFGYLNLVTVSKTEIDTLITGNGLVAGGFYRITGVNTGLFGGTDIILQAVTNNLLAKTGVGFFYNPKYETYNVWDNADRVHISSTTGFFNPGETIIGDQAQRGTLIGLPGTTTLTFINTSGNWSTTTNITGQDSAAVAAFSSYASSASYSIGDKVIWGGTVWVNLTGAVGTSSSGPLYTLDNVNWSGITYNTTDYTLVLNDIEYDYANDNISYREDNTNKVYADFATFQNGWGFNQIGNFPWGNQHVTNITIDNSYINNLINFPITIGSSLSYVDVVNNSSFDATNWGIDTNISYISIKNNSTFLSVTLGDKSKISTIEMIDQSNISGIVLSNNDTNISQFGSINLDVASTVNNIYLYATSTLYDTRLGVSSSLGPMNLYGCSLYAVVLEGFCGFGYNNFGVSSNNYNIYLGTNSSIEGLITGTSSAFFNIRLGNTAQIGGITITDNSAFTDINLGNSSSIGSVIMSGTSCTFQYIEMVNASSMSTVNMGASSQLSRMTVGNNSGINNITLGSNSVLQSIDVGLFSGISSLIVDNSASFTNVKLNLNSGLNSVNVNTGLNVSNFELGVDFQLNNITLSSNLNDIFITQNGSNFPHSVDITGASVLDLTTLQHVGVINLTSSNGTETINSIINGRVGMVQSLQPSAGLTVTVGNTAVGSLNSDGQILSTMSNFNIVGNTLGYYNFQTINNGSFTYVKQVGGDNYI